MDWNALDELVNRIEHLFGLFARLGPWAGIRRAAAGEPKR